jgi:hypothetical protein
LHSDNFYAALGSLADEECSLMDSREDPSKDNCAGVSGLPSVCTSPVAEEFFPVAPVVAPSLLLEPGSALDGSLLPSSPVGGVIVPFSPKKQSNINQAPTQVSAPLPVQEASGSVAVADASRVGVVSGLMPGGEIDALAPPGGLPPFASSDPVLPVSVGVPEVDAAGGSIAFPTEADLSDSPVLPPNSSPSPAERTTDGEEPLTSVEADPCCVPSSLPSHAERTTDGGEALTSVEVSPVSVSSPRAKAKEPPGGFHCTGVSPPVKRLGPRASASSLGMDNPPSNVALFSAVLDDDIPAAFRADSDSLADSVSVPSIEDLPSDIDRG